MTYTLTFSKKAAQNVRSLTHPSLKKRLKAVYKTLSLLEANPKHPGLHTHKHTSLSKKWGEEIFEAYAENRTPGAYRIFWYYGPEPGMITIFDVTSHP